jgi:hypothetical protein
MNLGRNDQHTNSRTDSATKRRLRRKSDRRHVGRNVMSLRCALRPCVALVGLLVASCGASNADASRPSASVQSSSSTRGQTPATTASGPAPVVILKSPEGFQYRVNTATFGLATSEPQPDGSTQSAPPGQAFITVSLHIVNAQQDRPAPLSDLVNNANENQTIRFAFPRGSWSPFLKTPPPGLDCEIPELPNSFCNIQAVPFLSDGSVPGASGLGQDDSIDRGGSVDIRLYAGPGTIVPSEDLRQLRLLAVKTACRLLNEAPSLCTATDIPLPEPTNGTTGSSG